MARPELLGHHMGGTIYLSSCRMKMGVKDAMDAIT